MLTMGGIREMMAEWTELRIKYPRYAIRWSAMAGDSAYRFKCPGWDVMVAPRSWKERWDALPEPKIPELSEREFEEFWNEWTRHIQVATVARCFKPSSA